MILLWGIPNERPLAMVRNALERTSAPIVCFDQRDVLDTEVELSVDTEVRGTVRASTRSIDLSTVRAVYVRPYDWRLLPDIEEAGPGSPQWQHALAVEDTLAPWLELTPVLVINRLSAMAGNGSKPYQAEQTRSFGFEVPETLVTTDPTAAREFWDRHGTVIYKSVSGVRSIVSRLTREHAQRVDDVVWCPTQFQQYIPGPEVRVHVVGDELFACEIIWDADDYRYAGRQGGSVRHRSYHLPAEWAERCHAMATAMGLVVAGVDLRHTPDGRWYCFEVNPSPAFTYYQQETNHPIDEAITRLLVQGVTYAHDRKVEWRPNWISARHHRIRRD